MTPEQHKKWYENENTARKSLPIDAKIADEKTQLIYAAEALKFANDHFHENDTDKRFLVAYSYRLAADCAFDLKIEISNIDADHLYHYAAHQLKSLNTFNQAAICYQAGGECYKDSLERLGGKPDEKKKSDILEFAIRSFARAKMCYQEIGESEKSATAYHKEQEVRREFLWHKKKWLTALWYEVRRVTTNYGESLKRLFITFLCICMAFSIAYTYTSYMYKWPNKFVSPLRTFLKSTYTYIAVSAGFGEIIDVRWQVKIFILLNILTGYLLLALIFDFIIRKFKET